MANEIAASTPALPVAIAGVNAVGLEAGNPDTCAGRTLPWLQDDASNVWGAWDVTFRDVVVLDRSNRVYGVYNLTANDLATPARYDELKALIVAAANAP